MVFIVGIVYLLVCFFCIILCMLLLDLLIFFLVFSLVMISFVGEGYLEVFNVIWLF